MATKKNRKVWFIKEPFGLPFELQPIDVFIDPKTKYISKAKKLWVNRKTGKSIGIDYVKRGMASTPYVAYEQEHGIITDVKYFRNKSLAEKYVKQMIIKNKLSKVV